MEKGRISMDELSKKLVSSRKIMSKVETGDYETGNINKDVLLNDPENLMGESVVPVNAPATRPIGPVNKDKINQSRLPDAIKKAMIDTPIEQITLNENLDMKFVENTRRLMEQEGVVPTKGKQTQQRQNVTESPVPTSAELERRLAPIIENIVRKTITEILDEKLNQILLAQNATAINENLAIKVGNTIFTGKITKSKSAK